MQIADSKYTFWKVTLLKTLDWTSHELSSWINRFEIQFVEFRKVWYGGARRRNNREPTENIFLQNEKILDRTKKNWLSVAPWFGRVERVFKVYHWMSGDKFDTLHKTWSSGDIQWVPFSTTVINWIQIWFTSKFNSSCWKSCLNIYHGFLYLFLPIEDLATAPSIIWWDW